MKSKFRFILVITLLVVTVFSITGCKDYSNYKNEPGYKEYISDRDSGYKGISYFGTKDVLYDNEQARQYYKSNARRYGWFLITDYEDGVCINDYYGLSGIINVPKTLGGKPVVKIGANLIEDKLGNRIVYRGESPFSGKGRCVLNIPSTVKYISYASLIEPRGMLTDEEIEKMFTISAINVNKDNPYYYSENGILFSKDKKSILHMSEKNDIFEDEFQYIVPEYVSSFNSINDLPFQISDASLTFPKNIKCINTILYDDTGTDASDNSHEFKSGLVVKGYKGTVAEKWAKKYNLKFIALDE